jgi:hypothetical protein
LKIHITRTQRIDFFRLLVCGGISIVLGSTVARLAPNGMGDFKSVYYAARCLIEHRDPYLAGEPLRVYLAEGGDRLKATESLREVFSLHLYSPATFIVTTPFALLPYRVACLLWIALSAACFLIAAFLTWKLAGGDGADVSLFLICFVLANSEMLFVFGNSAGIAVSCCIVAAWCFLEGRFAAAGIVCMALSLAIKPHDAGLVWLYFLLAGGVLRKRALQTLTVAAALALPVILWVSRVAPHWPTELSANLSIESAHGYLSDPGPGSLTGHTIGMIIDLQSILSLFRDDARFYNFFTYLLCGTLLLLWALRTLRGPRTAQSARLALAAVVPLSMLITYHRTIDAKLLLLAVPACAMLWAEGSAKRWIALVLTSAAILLTSDIPLAILLHLTAKLNFPANTLSGEILTALVLRPIPLVLLMMGLFYLWLYLQSCATPLAPKPE